MKVKLGSSTLKNDMKNRYWLIKRSGSYYAHDSENDRRESLGTKNKAQAQRLIAAKNETVQNTALNLQLGKVYLAGHDPKLTTRTWAEVMDELADHGKDQSKKRCRQEMNSKPFDLIRDKKIVETTGDDLRAVLQAGKSATNNYLHRLHNLAVGLGWLPWPIIPPKRWPKVTVKEKRGVTSDEHEAIIAAEGNAERRDYYQMLWETGAAQSDAAAFSIANIDWRKTTFTYARSKTGSVARLRIGSRFKAFLQLLPQTGPFFPAISQQSDTDRAAEFARRCRILKITGISLHSYRYGWAERALANGYPERFAQAALGHNSRAVHQAYARRGEAVCPSLEEYEGKIVPFQQESEQLAPSRESAGT
jgi:integrase